MKCANKWPNNRTAPWCQGCGERDDGRPSLGSLPVIQLMEKVLCFRDTLGENKLTHGKIAQVLPSGFKIDCDHERHDQFHINKEAAGRWEVWESDFRQAGAVTIGSRFYLGGQVMRRIRLRGQGFVRSDKSKERDCDCIIFYDYLTFAAEFLPQDQLVEPVPHPGLEPNPDAELDPHPTP